MTRSQTFYRLCLVVLPLALMMCLMYVVIGGDVDIARYFAGMRTRHPGLTKAMRIFSSCGNAPYYIVYLVLLFGALRRRQWKSALFPLCYVGGLLLTLGLCSFLKDAIGRPRPLVEGGFQPFSDHNTFRSFPSNHMSETFATTFPLVVFFRSWGFALLASLSPVMMGFARIYLGRHHPSDYLGSLVVGGLGTMATWYLAASPLWDRLAALPLFDRWRQQAREQS